MTGSVLMADLQGVVRWQYRASCSRYLLIHFESRTNSCHFLEQILPLLKFSEDRDDPVVERIANLGLTFAGLKALGVDAAVLQEFPDEFKLPPDARTMGDFGSSDPSHWWNGKIQSAEEIHAMLFLFGASQAELDRLTGEVRGVIAATGVREVDVADSGDTIEGCSIVPGSPYPYPRLHFGYRDGLSQPDVAWSDDENQTGKVNFRHFVLGYSTGSIPSAPKVVASNPKSGLSEELVRNGSYCVFRWLYQDVARFNRFLETEAPKVAPAGVTASDAREWLASRILGRWRDGTPVLLSPNKPAPDLANRNDFTYAEDPEGKICPPSAHARVSNPRKEPLFSNEMQLEPVVPRVLRRGTPFGPWLDGTTDDGRQRGLVGMFYCSSIARQFYKMMLWMKQNNFSPVYQGNLRAQDPFANREVPMASDKFHVPETKATANLQQFSRTLGTAFFLVPGKQSLSKLSSGSFS